MPKNPKLIDKSVPAHLPTAVESFAENWLHGLAREVRTTTERLLMIAEGEGIPAYLVGGPLRDLLLGRPSFDIDIAVEGDAIDLAQAVLRGFGLQPNRPAPPVRGSGVQPDPAVSPFRLKTHAEFGTATISGEGFAIDVATARAESYTRPGALPAVRPASIQADLRRRDFTINAMALRLNGPERGRLLDPAGGQADLEAGRIRVLHERSFQDDATRILRAGRYEQRFAFLIEEQTLARLRRDLRYLDTISGARLHHEFARIFAETEPERALLRLQEMGALDAVFPGLTFDERLAAAFAELRQLGLSALAAPYWALLAWPLDEPQAAAFAGRLALTKRQREAVQAVPRLRRNQSALAQSGLRRSDVFEMLSPFPLPAVWALAVMSSETLWERVLDYLRKARHERPHLNGDHLLAMGFSPGPELGEALRRLRSARLDREVRTKRDEVRLVQAMRQAAPT